MGSGAVKGSRQASKATYVILLLLSGLMAWLVEYYGPDGGKTFAQLDFSCDGQDGNTVCSDIGFVYRVSFINVLFFSFMLLATFPVPTCTGEERFRPLCGWSFHLGWWSIKLILYLGAMCSLPWLPSSIFDNPENGFAWVARVASGLFIILQVLLLIDFSYQLNEDWLDRTETGSKGWLVGLYVITFLMFGGGLAFTAIIFAKYDDCRAGKSFAVVNLILFVIYATMTVFREKFTGIAGSAVPVSIVFFYTSYLVWSATESIPSTECHPFDDGNSALVIVGVIIALVSLVWLAYTASKRTSNLLAGDTKSEEKPKLGDSQLGGIYEIGEDKNGKAIMARDTIEVKDDEANEEANNKNDSLEDKPHIFYSVLIFASFYMAMILTNWGISENSTDNSTIGTVSSWVKIAASWLTVLLYVWTIVAPLIINRDFDY